VLERLQGVMFRSLTTNGLPLENPDIWDRLIEAKPEKVHISIHFPERESEVSRVIRQVNTLANHGIRSGVNFLVSRSHLDVSRQAAIAVRAAGIGNERIVYLPMRGQDTPTPAQVAAVAGVEPGMPFQSMSCLSDCSKSPRFASIGWNKTVAWCSHTVERRPLSELTYCGLEQALDGLGLVFCGGTLSGGSLNG